MMIEIGEEVEMWIGIEDDILIGKNVIGQKMMIEIGEGVEMGQEMIGPQERLVAGNLPYVKEDGENVKKQGRTVGENQQAEILIEIVKTEVWAQNLEIDLEMGNLPVIWIEDHLHARLIGVPHHVILSVVHLHEIWIWGPLEKKDAVHGEIEHQLIEMTVVLHGKIQGVCLVTFV